MRGWSTSAISSLLVPFWFLPCRCRAADIQSDARRVFCCPIFVKKFFFCRILFVHSSSLHFYLTMVFFPSLPSAHYSIQVIYKGLGVWDTDVIEYLGPKLAKPQVVGTNLNSVAVVKWHAFVEGFGLWSETGLCLISCFVGLGVEWVETLILKKCISVFPCDPTDLLVHLFSFGGGAGAETLRVMIWLVGDTGF